MQLLVAVLPKLVMSFIRPPNFKLFWSEKEFMSVGVDGEMEPWQRARWGKDCLEASGETSLMLISQPTSPVLETTIYSNCLDGVILIGLLFSFFIGEPLLTIDASVRLSPMTNRSPQANLERSEN